MSVDRGPRQDKGLLGAKGPGRAVHSGLPYARVEELKGLETLGPSRLERGREEGGTTYKGAGRMDGRPLVLKYGRTPEMLRNAPVKD